MTNDGADPSGYAPSASQRPVLRWTICIGYAALVAGVLHGLAQALAHAKIDYDQGLTARGVANVLTFAFSNRFRPR